MNTLFLVIPRRISVRCVLTPGIISLLKNERPTARIVILTSIKDQKFIDEFSGQNVIVEYIPMRDAREHWSEKLLRLIRNYIGGVGFGLNVFKNKLSSNDGIKNKLFKLLQNIVKHFIFLRTVIFWLDIKVNSVLFDKDYEKLFQKYDPDVVFVHSVFELTAVPVVRVANRYKITTIGMVHSWDNLVNRGEMYSKCDQLIVWNEDMKNSAVKYHDYKPENIHVYGAPQFNYYLRLFDRIEKREEFFKRKKLNINKKLIVYTTIPERSGGSTEVNAIAYMYDNIVKDSNNTQLLVRIYTRDSLERYVQFRNKENLVLDDPRLLFDDSLSYKEQDDNFVLDLAATMKYADVVVCIASTITIDALFFNTPVVNLSLGNHKYYYLYEYYQVVTNSGVVSIARDEAEISFFINYYFTNRSIDEAARKKLLGDVCGPLTGDCLKLTAKLIAKYL